MKEMMGQETGHYMNISAVTVIKDSGGKIYCNNVP